MADYVWNNVGGDNQWSTHNNWDLADGTYPGEDAGDTATFNNTVVDNCTLDVSPGNALTDFDMAGGTGYTGTLAMGTNDLDVDGNCVLDGTLTASAGAEIVVSGNFTKTAGMTALPSNLTIEHAVTVFMASRVLICNSVTGGQLKINGTWNSVPSDDGYWDSFTMTAGNFWPASIDQYFAGSITYGSGSTNSTGGVWSMTGSGTIGWTSGDAIAKLHIASGVTATSSNYIRVLAFDCEGTLTGSHYLHLYYGIANNFWTHRASGTVSIADVYLQTNATISNADDIVIANQDFRLLGTKNGAYTLTLNGALNLGTGTFKCDASNADVDLILSGNLTCGDLILGHDPARATKIDLGNGTHTITGDIERKNADPGTLSIDMGQSVTTLSGEFNGASITVTGEALGSGHAEIHGGTLIGVNLPADDATLDATDNVTDGQDNSNVWFSGMSGGHTIAASGFGVCGSGKISA